MADAQRARMILYLSGAMTGIPELNRPQFDEAARQLAELGHDPIVPHDLGVAGSYEQTILHDLQVISNADGIVLLEGWEHSTGSRFEAAHAVGLGKPVAKIVHGALETMMSDDVLSLLQEPPSSNGEIRITDPNTGGMKGTKPARFGLIPPQELWDLAEHYGKGARKYADYNWQKGYGWHLAYDAMMRHAWAFWGGEDIDPETGSHHMIAAAWHCLTLTWFSRNHPDGDDRPPT